MDQHTNLHDTFSRLSRLLMLVFYVLFILIYLYVLFYIRNVLSSCFYTCFYLLLLYWLICRQLHFIACFYNDNKHPYPYWGWWGDKDRSLEWWELMPLVSKCFIVFPYLFHTAVHGYKAALGLSPFLAPDWFASILLHTCDKPLPKWITAQILKPDKVTLKLSARNTDPLPHVIYVYLFKHLGDALPIANSKRLHIGVAILWKEKLHEEWMKEWLLEDRTWMLKGTSECELEV